MPSPGTTKLINSHLKVLARNGYHLDTLSRDSLNAIYQNGLKKTKREQLASPEYVLSVIRSIRMLKPDLIDRDAFILFSRKVRQNLPRKTRIISAQTYRHLLAMILSVLVDTSYDRQYIRALLMSSIFKLHPAADMPIGENLPSIIQDRLNIVRNEVYYWKADRINKKIQDYYVQVNQTGPTQPIGLRTFAKLNRDVLLQHVTAFQSTRLGNALIGIANEGNE